MIKFYWRSNYVCISFTYKSSLHIFKVSLLQNCSRYILRFQVGTYIVKGLRSMIITENWNKFELEWRRTWQEDKKNWIDIWVEGKMDDKGNKINHLYDETDLEETVLTLTLTNSKYSIAECNDQFLALNFFIETQLD